MNTPEDPGRRIALTQLLTLGALALPPAAYAARLVLRQRAIGQDVRDALARNTSVTDALKNDSVESRKLDISKVVPECERTAEDVLLSSGYLSPKEKVSWDQLFEAYFGPMIRAMPTYTRFHVAMQDNISPNHAEVLKARYGREFECYPCFNTEDASIYAQDMGESLGRLSPTGQFQIATPRMDIDELNDRFNNLPLPPVKYNGDTLLFDNVLAKKYPHRFSSISMDPVFMGGNFSFGLLPNGERCIFVAKVDLVQYMCFYMKIDPREPATVKQYQEAKEKYCEAFGTKNIVVVDEEDFLQRIRHEPPYQAARFPRPFFHDDMIFMQHRANGKPVMFVSSMQAAAQILELDSASLPPQESAMLERVAAQFESMGYDVVKIPVIVADCNSVNVIPFTHKETGKPHIVLPAYHMEEDEEDFDEEEEEGPRSSRLRSPQQQFFNHMLKQLFRNAQMRYERAGIEVTAASYEKDNLRAIKDHTQDSGTDLTGIRVKNSLYGGFHCKNNILR